MSLTYSLLQAHDYFHDSILSRGALWFMTAASGAQEAGKLSHTTSTSTGVVQDRRWPHQYRSTGSKNLGVGFLQQPPARLELMEHPGPSDRRPIRSTHRRRRSTPTWSDYTVKGLAASIGSSVDYLEAGFSCGLRFYRNRQVSLPIRRFELSRGGRRR